MGTAEIRHRPAARVLVIDKHDRVLLIRYEDLRRPEKGAWWITPGGGLNPGESAHDGARRELLEEVGLVADQLGESVYRETTVWTSATSGTQVHQHQEFFVVRVDDHVPDFSGHEEYERRLITETRWWSAAELRSTAEECFPATLADLLTDVLAKTPAADHLKR